MVMNMKTLTMKNNQEGDDDDDDDDEVDDDDDDDDMVTTAMSKRQKEKEEDRKAMSGKGCTLKKKAEDFVMKSDNMPHAEEENKRFCNEK
jgi:hypothetical protein